MNSFKKFISIDEKEMTPAQEKRREEIVLSLKKKKDEFKERYGSEWEDVMYATATKMAMKGEETELDEMVYDVGAKPRFGFKTGDSTKVPMHKFKSRFSWKIPNHQRMNPDGTFSERQLKFLRKDFERFEEFGPKTHKLYKQIITWLHRQEDIALLHLAELEPRIRWLSHYAYNLLVSKRVPVKSKIFGLDEKIRMLNYGEDITYVVSKKTRKVIIGPVSPRDAKNYVDKNGGGWKFTILDRPQLDKKVGDKIGVLEQKQLERDMEIEENYDNMMKWYETSNEKKVYAILDKNNIKLPAEGFTLVQNMLKKHRDNVKKAADEIMNKHYPHLKESVDELDEAWDAEGVERTAKTGYGINMKGGKFSGKKPPKTPFDYMKISNSTGKKYKVQFGLGKKKEMFIGTAEEVADKINDLFGFAESIEMDEARNDTITMTFEFPDNRKAKKFAYDISNSLIATGDVIGNKVEVEPFDYERKTQQALDKYMKKNGGELIDEDAPANSAGSGGVSGFTPDTVGVSKDDQKKHKKKKKKMQRQPTTEETKTYSTFMEGLEKNIRSWNSGNDRIMVREKDGHPVFIVSVDEFAKCKSKRKKFERWSKFFDPKSASGRKIKEYSHKNPSKPIVLQCSQTGEMIYMRRRLNDSRLRHNKKKSGLTND